MLWVHRRAQQASPLLLLCHRLFYIIIPGKTSGTTSGSCRSSYVSGRYSTPLPHDAFIPFPSGARHFHSARHLTTTSFQCPVEHSYHFYVREPAAAADARQHADVSVPRRAFISFLQEYCQSVEALAAFERFSAP